MLNIMPFSRSADIFNSTNEGETMRAFVIVTLLLLALNTEAIAATKYKISGKVVGSGTADMALLISKSGIKRAAISGSRFSFTKLSAATLKNSRLYFFKDGAPVGPGALKEAGSYKYFNFSGKAPKGVRNLSLTFQARSGYLKAKKKPAAAWLAKTKVANANFTGASLGYPGADGSAFSTASARVRAASESLNSDADSDGVPDVLDIDDDNDGITDERDSGGGSMISSLYLPFSSTMNAHLGNLNEESIAVMFAAENVFGLTMFVEVESSFPTATGGHVICDNSQLLCRSAAAGGTSSYYTGLTESDPEVMNQVWSDYNADGSGKPNLEPVLLGGMSSVLVAAIQPRTAEFRAGELVTANITRGSTVLGTRVFSILPPNISSPMLYSYDTGSGETLVDYDDPFAPGSSNGNPIVMNGNTLTMGFYPPQRRPITGVEEDGAFRDIGNSSIGALIGGNGLNSEFTCAGLYSGMSEGMTEIPLDVSMPDGQVSPNAGAVLWPVVDSTPDVIYTSGTLKSMTVDLATCLSRASVAPGTYTLTLTYAGTNTSFGAPRSAQMIYVTIPAVS
jgi:hypothetical protein